MSLWSPSAQTPQAMDAEALAAQPWVITALGAPLRLYSEPVTDGAFPHADWRSWTVQDAGSSASPAMRQDFTIEVRSRNSDDYHAQRAVDALVEALGRIAPAPRDGQRITFIMPTVADVMRSPDLRVFRGLVRLRVLVEPDIATAAA